MATSAATSARRIGFNATKNSCGAATRITVNASSARNPSRLPAAASVSAAGAASGRHQAWYGMTLMSVGTDGGLHAPHADRPVEKLDVSESVGAIPPKDFGIEELPLVARRVPVERVQP